MSRERKARRDERRRNDAFNRLIEWKAKAESRSIDTPESREQFVRELQERGELIEMGPDPSGMSRRMSIRFDDDDGPEFSSLEDLFKGLFGGRFGK